MKQAIKHYRKRMKKKNSISKVENVRRFVLFFGFVFLDTPPLDRSWNENRKKLSVTVSQVLRVCLLHATSKESGKRIIFEKS